MAAVIFNKEEDKILKNGFINFKEKSVNFNLLKYKKVSCLYYTNFIKALCFLT